MVIVCHQTDKGEAANLDPQEGHSTAWQLSLFFPPDMPAKVVGLRAGLPLKNLRAEKYHTGR